jgi:hypothetical protein
MVQAIQNKEENKTDRSATIEPVHDSVRKLPFYPYLDWPVYMKNK